MIVDSETLLCMHLLIVAVEVVVVVDDSNDYNFGNLADEHDSFVNSIVRWIESDYNGSDLKSMQRMAFVVVVVVEDLLAFVQRSTLAAIGRK